MVGVGGRARVEDRIRNLKDTGLRNLPFHGFDRNQMWLEIIASAADLLVWTQTSAVTNLPARRRNPNACSVSPALLRPWPCR